MPADDILDLRHPGDRRLYRARVNHELRHATIAELHAQLGEARPRGTNRYAMMLDIANMRIAKALGLPDQMKEQRK